MRRGPYRDSNHQILFLPAAWVPVVISCRVNIKFVHIVYIYIYIIHYSSIYYIAYIMANIYIYITTSLWLQLLPFLLSLLHSYGWLLLIFLVCLLLFQFANSWQMSIASLPEAGSDPQVAMCSWIFRYCQQELPNFLATWRRFDKNMGNGGLRSNRKVQSLARSYVWVPRIDKHDVFSLVFGAKSQGIGARPNRPNWDVKAIGVHQTVWATSQACGCFFLVGGQRQTGGLVTFFRLRSHLVD